MYDNYAQLFNDIDRICENQITNQSYSILCFFRNDTSHYRKIREKACKIYNNTTIKDAEKIKMMTDLLLGLYHTDKNLMGAFKNIISKCLNISQREWEEYHSIINDYAKVAFDCQTNSGQLLLITASSISRSLKIHDPIEKRIPSTKQRISSNYK